MLLLIHALIAQGLRDSSEKPGEDLCPGLLCRTCNG